jgi:hypothetical protein
MYKADSAADMPADTSTRQSFNKLFGACPYCSSAITVNAVET